MTDEERKTARKNSIKKYNDKNREKHKLYYQSKKDEIKKSHDLNKEGIHNYNVKYYQNNIEKERKRNKEYRNSHPEYVLRCRKSSILWGKNKRKTDPLFKLKNNVRSLIRGTFKRKNVKKTKKTLLILGCTMEYFRHHIELQFEKWMTWENYGKYNGTYCFGWDIDHKIPVSSGVTEEEIIKLNHYTNLRPLCSKINRDIKRNLIVPQI